MEAVKSEPIEVEPESNVLHWKELESSTDNFAEVKPNYVNSDPPQPFLFIEQENLHFDEDQKCLKNFEDEKPDEIIEANDNLVDDELKESWIRDKDWKELNSSTNNFVDIKQKDLNSDQPQPFFFIKQENLHFDVDQKCSKGFKDEKPDEIIEANDHLIKAELRRSWIRDNDWKEENDSTNNFLDVEPNYINPDQPQHCFFIKQENHHFDVDKTCLERFKDEKPDEIVGANDNLVQTELRESWIRDNDLKEENNESTKTYEMKEKFNPQLCEKYRTRKRKEDIRENLQAKRKPKSGAQRAKEFRERQKMKKQIELQQKNSYHLQRESTEESEIQVIRSDDKTNTESCEEYREKKKIEDVKVSKTGTQRSDECLERGQNCKIKKCKTDAQRSKEYRERQKIKKLIELQQKNHDHLQSTSTKTSVESKKENRWKKKLKKQSIQFNTLLAKDHSDANIKKMPDGQQRIQSESESEKSDSQSELQASKLSYKRRKKEITGEVQQPNKGEFEAFDSQSDLQALNSPFKQRIQCDNVSGPECQTDSTNADMIRRSRKNLNSQMQICEHPGEVKQNNSLQALYRDKHRADNQHIENISFEVSSDVELDAYNNDEDDAGNTSCMDIKDIDAKIPIYTNYYEHANGHLQFHNRFKNNSFGHSCAVCDRLWWEKDLKTTTHVHDDILQDILPNFVCGTSVEVCPTCKTAIDKGKIPLLSTYNGFSFPIIPPHLPKLNLIEQRLISPRIPFMQIRRLRHVNGQYGIYGQIINVPVDVNTMVNQLPRHIDDDHCFYVHIENKLIQRTSNVHALINQEHIKQWLTYLVETPLYGNENITINQELLNSYEGGTELSIDEISEHISIEDNLTAQQQTLIWNEDKMLHLASGEKCFPRSILFDEFAEEFSFPTIYGGQFRTHKDGRNVTSFMHATSELRRTDRRATDPQHLLYMAAKIMRQRVSSSVCVALKHVGHKTKFTKEDIQSEEYINSCIESNLAFLRCIPNSAWYWADRKKDLFAMIRQFGAPIAFMTLSANETGWTDLLKLLYKLKNNGAEIDDALLSEMSYVHKAQLVNEDAVTCAIYFNKLVNCLLRILQSKIGNPFGEYRVKYYFKRIEFLHRGSPHAHILLWLENASEDLLNNCKNFIEMVDKLVSVSESEASGNIKLQTHKHTFTCFKKIDPNEKEKCRFGAPFLPSRNTITLMPMKETDSDYCAKKFEEYKRHYELLRTKLENYDYDNFDHFYTDNNIFSDEHYYNIIRAGISRPKLLYRRTPSEKWHNNFNPFIFHYLQSNMDFQIIQDEYACAAYVVEYVNKHNRGISNLQRLLIQTMDENPEFDVLDITKKLSIDVLHAVEMSAQEAAWYLLREPMVRASVVTVYIPTIYPTERQRIRKTLKEQSDLDEDCTNIWKENWFDKYEKRPITLENVTLAQFVANYTMRKKGEYYERQMSRVIRYRNYNMTENSNDYKREMVLLHIPFRSEDNDVLADNKFIQIYEDNKDLILERIKEFQCNSDFEKIIEICRLLGREDDEDE